MSQLGTYEKCDGREPVKPIYRWIHKVFDNKARPFLGSEEMIVSANIIEWDSLKDT